jgi:hypothetical protein
MTTQTEISQLDSQICRHKKVPRRYVTMDDIFAVQESQNLGAVASHCYKIIKHQRF